MRWLLVCMLLVTQMPWTPSPARGVAPVVTAAEAELGPCCCCPSRDLCKCCPEEAPTPTSTPAPLQFSCDCLDIPMLPTALPQVLNWDAGGIADAGERELQTGTTYAHALRLPGHDPPEAETYRETIVLRR